jgi:hypothetical protein
MWGLNARDENDSIKIYGCTTPKYVYLFLSNKRANQNGSKAIVRDTLDFKRYYYGKFDRSFSAVSEILSQRKFVVDLSVIIPIEFKFFLKISFYYRFIICRFRSIDNSYWVCFISVSEIL